jgi:NADH-quinone oxidoreductase subunit M
VKSTPSRIFIYANCLCLFIPTSGSFLLEDLYKLNLSATEQLWIFLAFFLAYAIKIHPFHTWQASTSACCRLMLLSGLCLKWDCIVLFLATAYRSTYLQKYMYIFISLGIAGVIYGSILAFTPKT